MKKENPFGSDQIPLPSLSAFDAAARHLSFTAAAEELCVTPSAISHRIRGLENSIGEKLFDRGAGTLSLTAKGKRFFEGISPLLFELNKEIQTLSSTDKTKLVILAPVSIAIQSIIPILGRNWDSFSRVQLEVETFQENTLVLRNGIDIAVEYKQNYQLPANAELLFREECAAYASPKVVKSYNEGNFASVPLVSGTRNNWDWHAWSEHNSIQRQSMNFRHYFGTDLAAIQAGCSGFGAILAPPQLVAEEVRSKKLCRFPDFSNAPLGAYFIRDHTNGSSTAMKLIATLQRLYRAA